MHRKNARLFPRIPVAEIVTGLVLFILATVLLVGLSWLATPVQAAASPSATWTGQAGQAMVQAARNLKH